MTCEGFLSRNIVKFTVLVNFCEDSDRLRVCNSGNETFYYPESK